MLREATVAPTTEETRRTTKKCRAALRCKRANIEAQRETAKPGGSQPEQGLAVPLAVSGIMDGGSPPAHRLPFTLFELIWKPTASADVLDLVTPMVQAELRMRDHLQRLGLVLALTSFSGCGATARLPLSSGVGPHPELPPPNSSLIPTVNVVTAKGWTAGGKPTSADGTNVVAFARGLNHPRWLYILPNGDVLVAETNAPPRPEDGKGVKGWFFKRFQKKAGGAVPSADRITLLRDADGDGIAEARSILLEHLHSPFGMALVGDLLYVADSDAILTFPYQDGQTHITAAGTKVLDLPAGPINHHWTKNVVAMADGSTLYVSVGSNSNVGENGIDKETERAAIWEVNPRTGTHRVYASGLRNPVGMAFEPDSGALWVAVNERDELGSDLVPSDRSRIRSTLGRFTAWNLRATMESSLIGGRFNSAQWARWPGAWRRTHRASCPRERGRHSGSYRGRCRSFPRRRHYRS